MTEQHPAHGGAEGAVGSEQVFEPTASAAPQAAGTTGTPGNPGNSGSPGSPGSPGKPGASEAPGSQEARAAYDSLEPDLLRATDTDEEAPAEPAAGERAAQGEHPDTALAAERLADLQRLQAEYVNYKRRVDRDRAVVQERAVQSVIEALLPVLDDIHAAREHGDLEGGPFAAIADKLESTLVKFGLERYGLAGEEFDPALHEALMHTAWPSDGSLESGTGATTVVQVLQPGYRAGDYVLRAARVAVADPE